MRALIAQLAAAMITPLTGATVTATMTTAVTIGTVAVIGQNYPNLVNIAVANQTTSSPPLTNLMPNATTMSSTRRSSKAVPPSQK